MSVTVLPYIDRNAYASQNTDNAINSNNSSNINNNNNISNSNNSNSNIKFDETLKEATIRATAAIAIDTLVAASQTGTVDANIVQNFFDQHNIKINVCSKADAATVSAISSNNGNLNTNATNSVSESNLVASPQYSVPTSVTGNTGSVIKPEGYSNSGILACSNELENYFEEASSTYGVDIKLLKAIAKQESDFNPNDVSHSGAVGIMQLMPGTAAELGVSNSYDPYQNIMGGSKYIAEKIAQYNGDVSLALAAYNAGSGNVAKYGGIPPFTETQNYVKKVLGYYNS